MAAPIDLLCVGLTTLDITVRPVESLPEGEAGQIVEKIALSPAGTAGGTAFVAQTLGLRTALSSAVGDDPQGQIVRSMLDGAGVDTSMLAIDPNWPTSTTVLPIRPNGDRPNWHMMGASIFAPVTEAEFDALDRTRNVHWAAVGFPGTTGKGADFLREAQARGVFTSCDLIAPTEAAQSDLDTLLPHVDLFMPSLAEMRELAGTDDPVEGARRFMARGAKGCLVKLGGGDSLCAGYIAGRTRGLDQAGALRFAVATAAQVAMGVGTLGMLEDYDSTLAFMLDTAVKDERR